MTLEQRLNRKKNELGLVGTRLNFLRPKEGRGLTEHITHDWKEIVVSIRQNLDPVPDEETRSYLKKVSSQDPLETIATDLLYHGCGHRELPTETGLGCPYRVEYHDEILNGIALALKSKGKNLSKETINYLANAFEDILDNINARKNTRHSGQILFWNNEGLEHNNKFDEFYEFFVRTNIMLWGSPEDNTLLKRFYVDSDNVKKAMKEFNSYLKSKFKTKHLVRSHEREGLFQKLFDKSSWKEMANRFTLAAADLLKDQQEFRLCFGKNPGEESDFDKLLKIPKTQEEIAFSRYKAGKGTSEHADPLLQLDALYRKISRSIPVRTSEYTQASGIPVAHFGRRSIKEDEDVKIGRIKGIGFTNDGDLTLKVSRHDLQHPATYKVHPRNFPKLKVALLDRSGSMNESPSGGSDVGDASYIPWGDNSKYHYTLKGLYGINNFLEKQGVAPYTQCEILTFSDKTTTTGVKRFRSEEERMALLRKPSGGTTIDIEKLKKSLQENSFLISVSDGDIQNWKDIKEEFSELIKNTDYFHIQIGGQNNFSRDLVGWGIPVKYVNGDDDLSRLMIDTTASYYRDYKGKGK